MKQIVDKKFNLVIALIKLLSEIFVPIIPALVAGGLLMALWKFLTAAGLFGPKSIEEMYPAIKGISSMIQLMSAAPFMFLPILVGISAAKRFGANQFLGATIGMIMTTPDLGGATEYWNIFGYHVSQINYAYQVIPVLASVYLLSILEKYFYKKLPSSIDFTFTPLLYVIITGFLTFTVIGPAATVVQHERNFAHVEQLFNFGSAIRKVMYTTNAIQSIHASFRKVTKKDAFPNENALLKLLYLRVSEFERKWTIGHIRDCSLVLNQLMINESYSKRIEKYSVYL